MRYSARCASKSASSSKITRRGRSGTAYRTRLFRWIVESTGVVFEAKFTLHWLCSEEAAAEKHMA